MRRYLPRALVLTAPVLTALVLTALLLRALVLTAPVLTALVLTAGAGTAVAAPPLERASVAVLPEISDHWLWVPDRMLQHSLLYDGDSGAVLGMVDSPSILTPKTPLVSRARGEIYSADTAYSRGLRGERVDFISIYDLATLDYLSEVVIPTRFASSNASLAYAERIGERFLGVFNQFPTTSVSIVDIDQRSFVGEIFITGCAGIYPVTERRFATLCGDGTSLLIELDAQGGLARRIAGPSFFDVVADPVFMAAGRSGTSWVFVSFAGQVTTVDFDGEVPRVSETWSLVDGAESADGWRPGGLQHVALHPGLQRLYVAMHRGEAGSHKEPGSEIWVYDLIERRRVARFHLPNLTAAFLAPQIQVEPASFLMQLLDWIVPGAGVHTLVVSQDDAPLLFARNAMLGAVAVLDARTGETLRVLLEAGLAGPTMRVP